MLFCAECDCDNTGPPQTAVAPQSYPVPPPGSYPTQHMPDQPASAPPPPDYTAG